MKNGVVYYDQYLCTAEEKLGFELNPNIYETFREKNFKWLDFLTPATAMSTAGYLLVRDGCKDLSKINNVHKIGVGRGLDLFDGSVARFMNQESDAGALADAGLDKLAMFTIARAAWKQNALPKEFISYIGSVNLAHFALTAVAAIKYPDTAFRPPTEAKYAMAMNNIAGGAYLYAYAFEHEMPEAGYHEPLRAVGHAATVGGTVLEIAALRDYSLRAA